MTIQRFLTSALLCLALWCVVAHVQPGPAAAALPTAPKVLPQLWAVETDAADLERLDRRTLRRLRAARFSLIAAPGLDDAAAGRLEAIARRWGLRAFRPQVAADAGAAAGFCVGATPAGRRCGVHVSTLAAARDVMRSGTADVTVVPTTRRALRRLDGKRRQGRLVATLALRSGRPREVTRLFRLADRSDWLDVGVDPAGPRAARALRRLARLVARRGGDRSAPAAPRRLRVRPLGADSVRLSWKHAGKRTRYGVYRDGMLLRSTGKGRLRVAQAECAGHRLAVDAVDRHGNRSRKRAVTAAQGACRPAGAPEGGGSTPPQPEGLTAAHLWIDGDGGACTRAPSPVAYADAAACGSAGEAYAAANAAQEETVVAIRGGQYGRFAITGVRSSPNPVVFDSARGERPVFGEGMMNLGDGDLASLAVNHVTVRNLTMAEFGAGAKNPDNRFGVYVAPHSTHIRLENLRAGNFLIQGAQHVQVIGGEYGPCRAADSGQQCEINKVDHYPGSPTPSHILIDGVDFHDYDLGPSCFTPEDGGTSTGSPDCHWRAMYLNGVHDLTLRNSRFRDSFIAPWSTISGPDAARVGNKGLLIENNVFGTGVNYGSAGRYDQRGYGRWESFDLAWCQNAASGVYAYDGVTYRFNSGSHAVGVFAIFDQVGCEGRVRDVRVYGNIGYRNDCDSLVEYAYNVYANSGTCAGTDRNADAGGALPFYAADTHAPGASDYALTGAASPADDLVPASAGCPATDRLGNPRGRNGYCDAGAYER